jgi:hypothetical protein
VAAFDRTFNSEWQEAILDLVELLKIEFPKNLEEWCMVHVSFALGLKLTDNNSYNNRRIIVYVHMMVVLHSMAWPEKPWNGCTCKPKKMRSRLIVPCLVAPCPILQFSVKMSGKTFFFPDYSAGYFMRQCFELI